MRRSKKEINEIKLAIYRLVKAERPMTVRQVFYRLVSIGMINKSETQYKGTVVRLLGIMRKTHMLPYRWISDNTRWIRKPDTYSSLAAALEQTANFYRRSLWNGVNAYVEIWLEKDSLSGVIYEETEKFDVPLMVTRGYPSLSFLYTAGEELAKKRKPCYLYYFGDKDPSGINIPVKVEEAIREFAPDIELHFERIAVTDKQIQEFNLLTRPTKLTDSRSKDFVGNSVELDAIPPLELRKLVKNTILKHISLDVLDSIKKTEELERATAQPIIDLLGDEYGI